MNKSFLAAALLSALLLPAHIIGGGADILAPVLAADLAPEVRAVVVVLWHGISATLVLGTVVLTAAAHKRARRRPAIQNWEQVAAVIVAAQYTGFAALFLVVGMTRLGNLTQMPQWTLFLAIAGLTWAGMRSSAGGKASK